MISAAGKTVWALDRAQIGEERSAKRDRQRKIPAAAADTAADSFWRFYKNKKSLKFHF